ncbi:hypothetical protein BV378_04910 [Nostoc sp. RF31YmG]|nr:hypothetical protein BV378_04910 [Nostoc sp. RF31YmG]
MYIISQNDLPQLNNSTIITSMKPNDLITLTAFITALTKLDEPLPNNIQIQLNDIGKLLTHDANNIGNLDKIAESYPPLDNIYQAELAEIDRNIGERSKGLEPLPLPEEPTKELTNAAINAFSNDDSVSAAKQAVTPNLLQKLRNFIIGKTANG